MAIDPIYSPNEDNEFFARMDSNRIVTGYLTILVKNIASDDGFESDDTMQMIKNNYTANAGDGGDQEWNKFYPLLGGGNHAGNLFGEGASADIGTDANVLALQGLANYSATGGDTLVLFYDLGGTRWVEVSRSVN